MQDILGANVVSMELCVALCLKYGWLLHYRFHHGDVQDAELLFVAPATIVSVATDSQAADKYHSGPSPGPKLNGHRATRWRGPPRRPEKVAWDRYSGWGARYRPPARAARLILRATEQRAGEGHQDAPKKQPGTAIRGYENAGLPRYIGERVNKKSV